MKTIKVGSRVMTPCRGCGWVEFVEVHVQYIGGGLIAVRHDDGSLLYYQPDELDII